MKGFLSSLIVSSSLLAVGAFAGSITLKNDTNYPMEVSGMVGLTATVNPVPAYGKTVISNMKQHGIAHLMFIDGTKNAYAGNVVLKKTAGWKAVSLYQHITIKKKTNGFVLRS